MSATRKWVLAAGLLSLLIAVGGYLALISPARARAQEVGIEAESMMASNQQMEVTIAQLRREAEQLQAQQQRLAQLDRRIPEKLELSTLLRQISGTVRKSGALTMAFTPSQPQPLSAVASSAGTNSTTGTTATKTPGSTPLFMVPLSLTLQGNFGQLEKILKNFEAYQRVFLITSTTVAPSSEDTTTNQLTMTINGRVFTRSDEFTATDAAIANGATAATVHTGTGGLG